MSKYINLTLALNKLWRLCEEDIDAEKPEAFDFGRAKETLQSLPTIEVMEYPQVEGITPTLITPEVSEDCISREYLKSFEYINKGDFNSVETIREWIDNAPSVVPTTEQSSMVGEWITHYETYEDSGETVPYGVECPLCGRWEESKEPFCNCGAKMRLE